MFRHHQNTCLRHFNPVYGTVTAATGCLRPGAAMIHHKAGPRRAAQQFNLIVQTKAAPMLPRPGGPFMQGIVAIKNRKVLLHNLHRRGFGYADGRTAVAQAVMIGIAAISAARNLIHHIVAPAFRIVSAKAKVARCACGRGGHSVWQGLHQGGKHRFRNALAYLSRTTRHRARILRIKERALNPGHNQRLKRASRNRHIGEDMPHRQIHR